MKFSNIWLATLAALIAGVVVNLAILYVTKPLAPGLEALSLFPVVLWTVVGTIGATLTYVVIRKLFSNPKRIFLITAWVVLGLSFIPDIAFFYLDVPGKTTAGILALMVMHVTVMALIVPALLKSGQK